MLIYIVRHGETNANVKGYLQGWTNDSLNENGIKLAIIHCSMNISTFILMFCVLLVLILFSPADTPQKPLAKDEKKSFKNKVIALAITTFILLLILFFFFDSITFIFFPILFGVLLETVSVIAGKMLNGKEVF